MVTLAEVDEMLDAIIETSENLRAGMFVSADPFTCYGGRLNEARRYLQSAVGSLRNAKQVLKDEKMPLVGGRCGGANPRPNRQQRRAAKKEERFKL